MTGLDDGPLGPYGVGVGTLEVLLLDAVTGEFGVELGIEPVPGNVML